jgi:hypothetical protein
MIYGRYGLNKLAQELEQDKGEFLAFLHSEQEKPIGTKEDDSGNSVPVYSKTEIERRNDGTTVAGLYQEIISGIRRLQAIAANRGI